MQALSFSEQPLLGVGAELKISALRNAFQAQTVFRTQLIGDMQPCLARFRFLSLLHIFKELTYGNPHLKYFVSIIVFSYLARYLQVNKLASLKEDIFWNATSLKHL